MIIKSVFLMILGLLPIIPASAQNVISTIRYDNGSKAAEIYTDKTDHVHIKNAAADEQTKFIIGKGYDDCDFSKYGKCYTEKAMLDEIEKKLNSREYFK